MSDSQYMRKVMNLFEAGDATRSIVDLSKETITQFYEQNGFVSFEHNGGTWMPKSASGKVDGETKAITVVYNWSVIGGDAGYYYARVRVDATTNKVVQAAVTGGAQADAEKQSKEQRMANAKEVAKEKYFPLIADALNNDPEIQKHVKRFADIAQKKWGDDGGKDGVAHKRHAAPFDPTANYSGMSVSGLNKAGDIKISISPSRIMGSGLAYYDDNDGLIDAFNKALSKVPGLTKLGRQQAGGSLDINGFFKG